MSDNLNNAFSIFLKHGFSVFPLPYGAKEPKHSWKKYQSCKASLEQCQQWGKGKYNVAIATGRISNIFVVDIDGKAGAAMLQSLEQQHNKLPETLTVRTGRGKHFYFRYPDGDIDINNLAGISAHGEVMEGIDIRGNGGYVVAPPSMHPSGKQYRFDKPLEDSFIAQAPAWLLALAVQHKNKETFNTNNNHLSEDFLQELIDKECGFIEDANEGGRNVQLNRSAFVLGQYIFHGLQEDKIYSSLKASALKIGLPNREVASTIKSGIKAGKQNPKVISNKWDNPDRSILERPKAVLPVCPHNLLGAKLERFVSEASACKCSPPDYIMASLLCAASGLIGNARRVKVWEGWSEPTALWFMLVGLPSCNKSPALDAVFPIIRNFEAEYHKQYQEQWCDYKLAIEQQIADRQFKDGNGTTLEEADVIEPMKPKMRRIIVNDSTVEKTAMLLAENVKGMISQRDELAGLLANLEKHGGNDRPFYLESFGGRPMSIDRIKYDHVIYVPSVLLSMIGSIQPDKLDQLLLRQPDDGLASRFLYVSGTPMPIKEPDIKPDYEMLNDIFKALEKLDVPIDENGVPQPRIVPICKKGRKLIEDFGNRLQLLEQKEPGMIVSHLGKLRGIAARIALVLQYLDWAFEAEEEPLEVALRHVEYAIRMAEDYFYPMSRHCLSSASVPLDEQDARIIANWILEEEKEVINARDIQRKVIRDKKRRDDSLQYLEESGWIKRKETGTKMINYDVNPLIFTT